jgi:hypothetical protein
MNDSKKQELIHYKEWCSVILYYIEEIAASDINTRKTVSLFLNTASGLFERADLKNIKKLANELSEWGRTLTEEQILELNTRLRNKFGQDLSSAKVLKRIEAIIKAERIKNLNEYRLMLNYFNDHFSDTKDKDQIEKIGLIIEKYQQETGNI